MNASDADVGRSAEITYALADLQPAASQSQGQGQGSRLVGEHNRPQATKDEDDAGECVEKFYIDPQFGVVTARMPLNHEQRAVYRCRVLAVDAGEPPNTGQTDAYTPCSHSVDFSLPPSSYRPSRTHDKTLTFLKDSYGACRQVVGYS